MRFLSAAHPIAIGINGEVRTALKPTIQRAALSNTAYVRWFYTSVFSVQLKSFSSFIVINRKRFVVSRHSTKRLPFGYVPLVYVFLLLL